MINDILRDGPVGPPQDEVRLYSTYEHLILRSGWCRVSKDVVLHCSITESTR